MSVADLRRTQAAANLTRAARNAPAAPIDAAARLLQATARRPEQASFVAAVLDALAKLPSTQQPGSATSSYGTLLDLLSQPEILDDLRRHDPLAPARLRGLRLKEQLLDAEGGACSAAELAQLLGVSRQAIDKRRKSGALIGLDLGRRGYRYPTWQVGLAGLRDTLRELDWLDPWSQLAFMLTPNVWLDGETPLALLRRGEVAPVIEAAQAYGEQSGA